MKNKKKIQFLDPASVYSVLISNIRFVYIIHLPSIRVASIKVKHLRGDLSLPARQDLVQVPIL